MLIELILDRFNVGRPKTNYFQILIMVLIEWVEIFLVIFYNRVLSLLHIISLCDLYLSSDLKNY